MKFLRFFAKSRKTQEKNQKQNKIRGQIFRFWYLSWTCPYRKDRVLSDYPPGTYSDPARGGVAILVKGSLNPELHSKGEAEIIWVKIQPLPNVEWLIGCCYRPEVAEEFMLTKICKSVNDCVDTENVVLTGDFNLRSIDWKKFVFYKKPR